MIETATTSATYDQIAADYAARWASAELLALARSRFAARLVPGACVLDVGCGPAWDTLRLRAMGLHVSGLDRSRGMLAQARQRGDLPLMLGDMRRLPVRNGALDGIWACASFLHIPKRTGLDVLREFRRALRPGGAVYIGVKRGTSERWVEHTGGLQRFFAFYQENEFDTLLASAGFAVCESWIGDDTLGREPWINRLALAEPL